MIVMRHRVSLTVAFSNIACHDEYEGQAIVIALTASVPSPVDAFTGILKVQLNTLINETSIARHDHCPSCVAGGHASDIEALFPLLVYPLEGKAV